MSEDHSTKVRWADAVGNAWTIEMKFAAIAGRVECVAVRVTSASGPVTPITVGTWRALPIGRFIREKSGEAAQALSASLGPPPLALAQPAAPRKSGTGRTAQGGRPPLSGDVLKEVAHIYASAYARNEHPTKAVAEAQGISRSTAAKRVMRARRMGYLAPTVERRAGGAPGTPLHKRRRRT